MDKLIKNHNFNHNNDDDDEFSDKVDNWTSDHNWENVKVSEVQSILTALADKMTKEKVPHYETKGWEQAKEVLSEISSIAEDIIENDTAQANQVKEAFLDFALRLMETSPLTTIHMRLTIDALDDRYLEMEDFLKNLQGEKLRRLLNAVTMDVKPPTEKVSEEDFYSVYDSYITHFQRKLITGEMLKANIKMFLDFMTNLYLDHWDKSEETCKTLTNLGSDVFREMDNPDSPWEIFDDIATIKSYFHRCIALFRNPGFSKANNSAVDEVRRYTNTMCKKLGSRNLIEDLCDEIFDLLLAIGQWSYPKDEEDVMRAFDGALDFITSIEEAQVKKRPTLFRKVSKRFLELVDKLDRKILDKKLFADRTMDNILQPAYGNNKEMNGEWVALMPPLIKKACMDSMRALKTVAYGSGIVKWKEHPDTAREVMDLIAKVQIPEGYSKEDTKKYTESFTNITKSFLSGLKKAKMLKNFGPQLILLSIAIIEMKNEDLYNMAEEVAENNELDFKEDKATIMQVVSRIHTIMKSEDYPWDECWYFQRALTDLIECLVDPVRDAKTYTIEEIQRFLDIVRVAQKYDFINPDTGAFGSDRCLCTIPILTKCLDWLKTLDRLDVAEDIIPGILKGFAEEEDETLYSVLGAQLSVFGQAPSGKKALGKYLGEQLQLYQDTGATSLLQPVEAAYETNTKAFRPHYRAFFDTFMDSADQIITMWMGQLFHKVSKMQPDLFTEKDMKMIIEKTKGDMVNQPTLLQICQELCKRRPESMIKYTDHFVDSQGFMPVLLPWINDMLCTLALHNKTVAPKVLDYLFKSVRTNQDKANLLTALNSIRLLCFKYPDLLRPRRAELEKIAIADSDGQSVKVSILDMIDGKTPDNLQKQLSQQQDDLDNLVGRVEDTEGAVAEVRSEVKAQGKDIQNVKKDVNKQGKRLDQVEETVDETVAKVEEIDQKTLSHAPYWSRDVSKLLNVQSEHDWRLLCSRLGYSNDDIRGWAQQADPCMAMLNEWYATRKTSEATHGIYNQLVEMDRLDAAIIVENAMKNAEAVVEDEEFEYASPPPVFISYQWSHQEEVKLLKKHLEMAGYECWLDIGQMGGGDKLFDKIDTGIRAAKVVISCVTEKYAKSPNCNREVNLSVNLNKPMIPLLMEKCTWPPPGSMGPIFSEYLFIRFFQRGAETTEDDRYWPKEKFQELLMQLNQLGLPPEEGKIESLYRNWWMPAVEEIKIDKSRTRDGGKTNNAQQEELDKKAAVSPDVFISYQWGKQKNIILLYQRLTSLGLTCWLDIKQMGGGDSLYDKIDRGVRGCKIVLSCVTQKYALSANCRREVSLADALKKPMVPLLLEGMTWPPSGPMSMVMTQLLYIDFTQEEVQTSWDGPKFEELLDKIEEHAPTSAMEEPAKKEKDKPQATVEAASPVNQHTIRFVVDTDRPPSSEQTRPVSRSKTNTSSPSQQAELHEPTPSPLHEDSPSPLQEESHSSQDIAQYKGNADRSRIPKAKKQHSGSKSETQYDDEDANFQRYKYADTVGQSVHAKDIFVPGSRPLSQQKKTPKGQLLPPSQQKEPPKRQPAHRPVQATHGKPVNEPKQAPTKSQESEIPARKAVRPPPSQQAKTAGQPWKKPTDKKGTGKASPRVVASEEPTAMDTGKESAPPSGKSPEAPKTNDPPPVANPKNSPKTQPEKSKSKSCSVL